MAICNELQKPYCQSPWGTQGGTFIASRTEEGQPEWMLLSKLVSSSSLSFMSLLFGHKTLGVVGLQPQKVTEIQPGCFCSQTSCGTWGQNYWGEKIQALSEDRVRQQVCISDGGFFWDSDGLHWA